jgi:hypothetical protein
MTSVVLVHTGRRRAPTLPVAIQQLQTYLPSLQIYLLTDRPEQSWQSRGRINVIDVNDLPKSDQLTEFEATTRVPSDFRDGFWLRVMSRHFHIAQFIASQPDGDWLHIENDCLPLVTPSVIEELVAHNKGIAVPFESRARAIPVLVHIENKSSMAKLTELLLAVSVERPGLLDMDIWAAAAASSPDLFTPLPTMPNEHWAHAVPPALPPEQSELVPANWQWKNAGKFSVIFDAAALGQFLAGPDPHNHQFRRTPSFVNPTSWLDVQALTWRLGVSADSHLPSLQVRSGKGDWVGVANLHMHSKKMRPVIEESNFWPPLIEIANQKRAATPSIAFDLIVNEIVDQPKQAPRMLADIAYTWLTSLSSSRK